MKIAVIDIETTGFLNQGGSIVEIGAVELDLETGEINPIFDTLCRESIFDPEKHKDSWVFQNSDLRAEMIASAPAFEEIAPKFQEVVDQYPLGVTAFNRNFDVDFLSNRGIKFGKLLPCPMLLSTPVCKLAGQFGGFKWPKAYEAHHHFFPEKEYVELHRGCDDARHEAEIIFALYKMGVFKLNQN